MRSAQTVSCVDLETIIASAQNTNGWRVIVMQTMAVGCGGAAQSAANAGTIRPIIRSAYD